MTSRRNLHRRNATRKAKEARDQQKALPARRQVEAVDRSTTRAAAARKPARRGLLSVKGWKRGHQIQAIRARGTRRAPKGILQ